MFIIFPLDRLKNATALDAEIIKYIHNHQEKVAYMRVRELAEATHVSPATVVRFSQKMGYDSFPELRLAIKQKLDQEKRILIDEENRRKLLSHDIFFSDYDEKVDLLAEKLLEADLIHCAGIGSSGIMGQYAAKQFQSIGLRAFASISAFVPYLKDERLIHPNFKELVLVFSVSGETFEVVEMTKLLIDTNIFIVSLTNQVDSTLSRISDLNISYDTSYDRLIYDVDISSQLPVVYTIETLVKKIYSFKEE